MADFIKLEAREKANEIRMKVRKSARLNTHTVPRLAVALRR